MAATKVQIIGGSFQDSEGNLLVNGKLTFTLNQDESVSNIAQLAAGITVVVLLDANGDVLGTLVSDPDTFIWPNDVLTPANSFYMVKGYTSSGQLAWGPNYQQVLSSPSPYNLDSWVPNTLTSWQPPLQNLVLQTNGTNNPNQQLENLRAGTGITLNTDTAGTTITSSGAKSNRPFNNQYYYTPAIAAAGIVLGGSTITKVPATTTAPAHQIQSTASANSNSTAITAVTFPPSQTTQNGAILNLSIVSNFQMNVWTPVTTNRRTWVGMLPAYGIPSSGLANNGVLQNDNPVSVAIAPSLNSVLTPGTGSAPAGYAEYDSGGILGGGSNALQGLSFVVTGFVNSVNNGTFFCIGSGSSSLILQNPNATPESHAATATAVTPTNIAAFRLGTADGGIWKAYCSNGTSSTVVSTGFAADNTNGHVFEIQQNVLGTFIFLIDGITKATINTTVPSGTMTAVVGLSGDSSGNGSVTTSIGWGYSYVELDI